MNLQPRPCRGVWLAIALAAATASACAQAVPAHPKKFTTRPLTGRGSTPDPGVAVEPKPAPKARYVTYLVLSEARDWTSSDGKTLHGKLIAFDDLVVEAPKGGPVPPAPKPPAHPTVVRDQTIRLLVNNKATPVPLSRLSNADQSFVEQIRSAREKSVTNR